jgi:UDP-4-amino-4,6-dideoxy-N-acetyl-beta-L-altrosamine N-acetyltransferase
MIKFRKMLRSDQEHVLRWRVKPEVAQFMLTEVEFNLEKQLHWFDRISTSSKDEYWIIENNGDAIGVISLNEIDRVNQRATWGLYVGEDVSSPVGGMLPIYFYNYVFGRKDLMLHKLYGMVLDINTNMLRIHDLCGYRRVGIHKDHVLRGGRFHHVHVVELLREDWLERGARFARLFAEFEDAFPRPETRQQGPPQRDLTANNLTENI